MRCKAWARMQMKPCIRMPDNKSPDSWQLLIFPLSALLSSPLSGNRHPTPVTSRDQKNNNNNLWSLSGDSPICWLEVWTAVFGIYTERQGIIQYTNHDVECNFTCCWICVQPRCVAGLSIPGLGAKTPGRRKQALPYNTITMRQPWGSERGYVLVSPHENNIKPGGEGRRGGAQVHLHKWLGATRSIQQLSKRFPFQINF